MSAWLPFAIQGGEGLLVGVLALVTTYQATHDWNAAVSAAVAAVIAKLLPKQILAKK